MNRTKTTWMSLLLAALVCGCASTEDRDLIESQLRQQENSIAQLRHQLASTEADLRVAQSETEELRSQLASTGRMVSILPEQANVLYRVEGIELHKYMTGGLDKDGVPGDEALAVLLVPQDQDGEMLKVPGGIQIDLFDMTRPPGDQNIGVWTFSPDEVQQAWYSGFFGSGFMLELPLSAPPQSTALTVHAKLSTTDGREFHTTKEVRVAPPDTANIATQPRPDVQAPPRMIPEAVPPVPGLQEGEIEAARPEDVEPSSYQMRPPAGIPTSNRWTERDRPTWR